MKIIAYNVRQDEIYVFEKFSKEYDIEIKIVRKKLSIDSVDLAKEFNGIIFIGNCDVNKDVLKKIKEFGIKAISSRSIGFNNVDIKAANELNISVSNASYSPSSVSEYSVMLGLSLTRKNKLIQSNLTKDNYGLKGIIGRQISEMVVGVIGVGRIGFQVAKAYHAMGAKVLGYDLYPNKDAKFIEYVDFDHIIQNSDLISIHAPLTKENYHMINKKVINMMKDQSFLVNAARGQLVSSNALLEALKNNKFGGVALDTIEEEKNVFMVDLSSNKEKVPEIIHHLQKFDNVILSPHSAFYTKKAVSDMVEISILNQINFLKGKKMKNEVKIST